MISILPRTVKEINRIRPFQKDTISALRSDARLIIVEAPVGSGKSHIVRQIADNWQGAVVLTYPTKILMDSQRWALKRDFPESVMWRRKRGMKIEKTEIWITCDQPFQRICVILT